MTILTDSNLFRLLSGHLSHRTTCWLLGVVTVDRRIAVESDADCSRAVIAQALNLALLADLLDRVPTARAYVEDIANASGRLIFDHGAVRTVSLDGMGSLPAGEEAILRVLRPLGYAVGETYPLDRLRMTGRSYRHLDYPEELPQFFVSELHVDRFSPEFQSAAARVTRSSTDPLDRTDVAALAELEQHCRLATRDAAALLGKLVACFRRRHAPSSLADYALLLSESAEMAWIATEGNAFNHATDRVPDLERLVHAQRTLGRPMKDRIEVSRSGRVRQTAYRADVVARPFLDDRGAQVIREVPGSFFEFIQRDRLPDESRLDLAFDTGNAQGIFKMTAAQTAR